MPFCKPKRPVSGDDTGRFAPLNGTYAKPRPRSLSLIAYLQARPVCRTSVTGRPTCRIRAAHHGLPPQLRQALTTPQRARNTLPEHGRLTGRNCRAQVHFVLISPLHAQLNTIMHPCRTIVHHLYGAFGYLCNTFGNHAGAARPP